MKWQKSTLMVREDKMLGSTFVLREAGPGDVAACLKAHPKEAAEIIGVTGFEAQANDALAKKCDELTESVDKANARIKELESELHNTRGTLAHALIGSTDAMELQKIMDALIAADEDYTPEGGATPLDVVQRLIRVSDTSRLVLDAFLKGKLKIEHVHDLEKALEGKS